MNRCYCRSAASHPSSKLFLGYSIFTITKKKNEEGKIFFLLIIKIFYGKIRREYWWVVNLGQRNFKLELINHGWNKWRSWQSDFFFFFFLLLFYYVSLPHCIILHCMWDIPFNKLRITYYDCYTYSTPTCNTAIIQCHV